MLSLVDGEVIQNISQSVIVSVTHQFCFCLLRLLSSRLLSSSTSLSLRFMPRAGASSPSYYVGILPDKASFEIKGWRGEGMPAPSISLSSGWKQRLSMQISFQRSCLFSSNWSQLKSNLDSETGGSPRFLKFAKYGWLIASMTEILRSGEKLSIF